MRFFDLDSMLWVFIFSTSTSPELISRLSASKVSPSITRKCIWHQSISRYYNKSQHVNEIEKDICSIEREKVQGNTPDLDQSGVCIT